VTDVSSSPGPPDPAGPGIDTTVPHPARIWNYWLGGTEQAEIYSYCGVGRKP
jgi:hypothetical protein